MLYQMLVETYQKLEKTTKRLEKTDIIADFLKSTPSEELQTIILLLQGKIFENYDESKIGVAARLVIKAINLATGCSGTEIEEEWKKTGDLGITTEILIAKKKQVTLTRINLTVLKIHENLKKIANLEGSGSIEKKTLYIAELLTLAEPIGARYIVRTILEELRIGIGEGTLRDAILWAFFGEEIGLSYNNSTNELSIEKKGAYDKYLRAIQNAYDITNDFGMIAEITKTKGIIGLEHVSIIIGRPIKVMLAQKVNTIEEGFERVGKPVEIEYKLDGFRIQIHKKPNGEITLYTRRLENVTKQFPDLVSYIKRGVKGESFILDGEVVGYDIKSKKYLPFQSISQRIKRKYSIEKMEKKFPVELNIFDLLLYEGTSYIGVEFRKRREFLERIVNKKDKEITVVRNLITNDRKEIEKFYKESLQAGNEGIMFKNLSSEYKPGSRVGSMVKFKPTMETLDLVITSAEWGEGKRANLLSSFTVSCLDENGELLEVGKVSTGLKEKEESGLSFKELTTELRPLIISENGKYVTVKPKIIIEVSYEEIQKSPTYNSGYALRFPRVTALRLDRASNEATTLSYLEEIYYSQGKTIKKVNEDGLGYE